jgi:acyl-CoA reductase-like NAD-dependent aldehyde dehydrogenase
VSVLSDQEVQAIIERVKSRLAGGDSAAPGRSLEAAAKLEAEAAAQLGDGIFADIDSAVAAAKAAQVAFGDQGLDVRYAIIESVRTAMLEHGEELARMAHEETGIGRTEDKIRKNRLVTAKTPGPEDLEPQAVTGDTGMMVTEFAPYGVIGSVTPTTNPTSTIINNSIAIVSAGNAVVFNAHPNAKRVSAHNIRLINKAIVAGGGPPNLVTAVAEPTIESAQALMNHPDVRVLLVTGGPGVVQEALKTNKKSITAGPGNPPVVVDETADIEEAGAGIVAGASFDNNVICTDEKEALVVASVADRLLEVMGRSGAYILKEHELRRLERVIFEELGPPNKPGRINRAWVGKSARAILNEIGVTVDDSTRLVVADVPKEHCLVWTEQMMPVFPVARVNDVSEAISLAVRVEHGFGHTASIYSRNVDTITKMAKVMNCSIFVANAPNFAGLGQGGEGYASFSIASPTGEGLTRPRTFSRMRRVTVVGALRIV